MDMFAVLFYVPFVVILLISWKSHFFPSGSLHSRRGEAAVSCAVMAVCACGIALVLLRWSANDVRDDSGELIFYFVFSLMWVLVAQMLFEFLGVSLRDDGVERRNRGALFVIGGATIGVSCCVAGSNVGNGPGQMRLCSFAQCFRLEPYWRFGSCWHISERWQK